MHGSRPLPASVKSSRHSKPSYKSLKDEYSSGGRSHACLTTPWDCQVQLYLCCTRQGSTSRSERGRSHPSLVAIAPQQFVERQINAYPTSAEVGILLISFVERLFCLHLFPSPNSPMDKIYVSTNVICVEHFM